MTVKKDIEINEGFRKALTVMENTAKNVFVTGKAGTGKSTLLEYFRSITRKKIAVLAPTGVAALNVLGQTIHSFFGFKPNITLEKIKKLKGERARIFSRPIYSKSLKWSLLNWRRYTARKTIVLSACLMLSAIIALRMKC